MFELLRRKRGAKEAESRPPEESREAEVSEDKGSGEQLVSLVDDLVEQRSASASTSVRSILKAAISSAEQIVDSVKMRAVEEAQQEAAKVIAEAKKEAEKIRGGKAPVQEETTESIISAVEEQIEEPAQAQEEVVAQQEAEMVQLPDETTEQAVAETVPQDEEPAVVEPVAEEGEPEEAAQEEEEADREEPEIVATKEESQSPYTGEVELIVEVPVEPAMVSKLYNYLQTTAEVKFVRTVGSWNKGSSITIALDKPIPLVSVLASKLPEANVVPEQTVRSDHVRGARRRINISLKNK